MIADAELTVNGALWCRITGWTTRRFTTDDRIWQVKLQARHGDAVHTGRRMAAGARRTGPTARPVT